MKKAVVKSVKPFKNNDGQQVTDNYGNFTFTVAFDNNDCGYYSTKDKDGAPFVVEQEAEYEVEEREGKKGKYFKIKRPQQGSGGWSGGGGKAAYVPKPPEQIKQETRLNARSMLMRYAVDLWIADRIKAHEIRETYEQLTSIYDDSITDITLG
jgi:hypothetical protein